MNFLSILLVMFGFLLSRAMSAAAANSSSSANITENDLVLVSVDLVSRYRADIEDLHFNITSFKRKLQTFVERNASLTAVVREKAKKKEVLLQIRGVIHAALNYTSGSDRRKQQTVCKMPVCEETTKEPLKVDLSNPTNALDDDIEQLDAEIEAENKKLADVANSIGYTSRVITCRDILIKKKMKVIEVLHQIYHI